MLCAAFHCWNFPFRVLFAAFCNWNLPFCLPVATFGGWNPPLCLPMQHVGAGTLDLADVARYLHILLYLNLLELEVSIWHAMCKLLVVVGCWCLSFSCGFLFVPLFLLQL